MLAHNVAISKYADKSYGFIREKHQLTSLEKKGIFSDVSSVFLYKIAWSLLNGTDNILISILIGTVYVGLYSNYYTITNNLETLIALLFTSLTASIGNLVATSAEKHRYEIFKTMQMVSFWICGFVVVSLFYLTQDFIQLWLGKDLLLDNLTLIAIIVNVFFSTCMRPVWTFREGTGMYRQIRYIMFVTAILNLILSIILGKWLGISGILFATSISKISTYFCYEPRVLLICYFPIRYMSSVSILNWVIKAVTCTVVMNGLYFIRYFRTDSFHVLKDKIRSVLVRSK